MMLRWNFAVPIFTLALLMIEHAIPHGRDLNPVHHWLSEYVLSSSPLAVVLMRLAFVGLAATALTVVFAPITRPNRALFAIGGGAIFAMTFFDTEPNGIPITALAWPPTASQMHKLLLYLALATVLLGMALHSRVVRDGRRPWLLGLFGTAAIATAVQTGLIAVSKAHGEPTQFGGITERVVVLAMLTWAGVCFMQPKGPKEIANHPAAQP